MTIQNLQFIVNVLNESKVTGIKGSRELLEAAGACEVLASKLAATKNPSTNEVFTRLAKLQDGPEVVEVDEA